MPEENKLTAKDIADEFLGSDAQGTDVYDDFAETLAKALVELMEEDY